MFLVVVDDFGPVLVAERVVDGLPEQVEDGVTGRLVPPQDTDALAAAMIEMLADPDLRNDMGRKGRAMLDARWSAPVVAAQTMDVYRRAIAEKAAVS